MKNSYVLDACALIAYLSDESGADIVAGLLDEAVADTIGIVMNKFNLLEVYYNYYRVYGETAANEIILEIKQSPIAVIADISDAVFMEAGKLKAAYRISIADSIALAEAIVADGYLVTSDHHELDAIDSKGVAKILWIR